MDTDGLIDGLMGAALDAIFGPDEPRQLHVLDHSDIVLAHTRLMLEKVEYTFTFNTHGIFTVPAAAAHVITDLAVSEPYARAYVNQFGK